MHSSRPSLETETKPMCAGSELMQALEDVQGLHLGIYACDVPCMCACHMRAVRKYGLVHRRTPRLTALFLYFFEKVLTLYCTYMCLLCQDSPFSATDKRSQGTLATFSSAPQPETV